VQARLRIDPERRVGPFRKNLFGHLLARRNGVAEEGLHDPSDPSADGFGVRQDIERLIRPVKPSVFRWPGGCTGTSYHWLDGVGPAEDRPRNIDLHFGWEAGYQFGTNEFVSWCRRMGAEPLINWNMGTGTLDEAVAWLDYCNGTGGTKWAELRREHGVSDPHAVRLWQLGNEIYGAWELGHTTAEQYAETAREWARAARRTDPSIEIIALGGALTHSLDWAWKVVPEVARFVDYITFHAFWPKTTALGDPWYALQAGPHRAEQYIRALRSIIDVARREVPGARPMHVAITEWNTADFGVHMGETPDRSAFQPYYDLRDALANASFLNILLRESDTVRLATSAQILNVRGHIMANDEGVWRETIYWPLHMVANLSGAGVLDAWLECDTFSVPEQRLYDLPILDVAITLDSEEGRLVASLVNRHPTEPISVRFDSLGNSIAAEATCHLLHHEDVGAMNGPTAPDAVQPKISTVDLGERAPTYELPPHSYAILEMHLG